MRPTGWRCPEHPGYVAKWTGTEFRCGLTRHLIPHTTDVGTGAHVPQQMTSIGDQDSPATTTTHAYVYKRDAALALHKALGLEGHKIKRVVLVFDVDQEVTATITEYSVHENHAEMCRVLTAMGPWLQDITSAEDDMRQVAKP